MTDPTTAPAAGGAGSRLGQLSPEKRALLERALLRRRAAAGGGAAIPPRDRGTPAPLSFPQQRLWFLDHLAPGNPTYNAVVGFRLHGPLDPPRLARAFTVVAGRHEVVRTVFRATDGLPHQHVLDDWELPLPLVDLRGHEPEGRDAELERLMREEPRRSYDLAHDLMMRLLLVRLDADEWVLLLMEHHIAFDGWSDEILCAEVAEVYTALGEGRAPELPTLPVQYGDFAAWQRTSLSDSQLDRLRGFWRGYLSGAPAPLPLPLDRPRPPVQTHEGARVDIALGREVLDPLTALCRRESATPYMVLLSLFGALLHRWAGVSDVCVGTPIANRARVELERLVGFFSNTLVIRVRPSATETFAQLVRGTREAALAAYEHQDLPFDRIVEAVGPPRDPSYNPLFQVNFRVTTGEPTLLRLPGVACEPVSPDIGFSRFDLALELQVGDGGVGGYLEYNLALFEAATARALASALGALLADALARPDVALGELSMTGAGSTTPGIRRRRR